MRASLVGLVAFLALSGCGDDYDNQVSRLEKHERGNRIGSGNDHWLVKRSFGVDDPVALIFGYLDDYEGCVEIAGMLNQRYPAANYTCKPAN